MQRILSLHDLANAYDIIDLSFEHSPVHLCVALPGDCTKIGLTKFPHASMPASGRTANGRGLDEASSHNSCLGEIAELLSCSQWGDENIVAAQADELDESALHQNELLGLTPAQFKDRHPWNKAMHMLDWRPPLHSETDVIDWMKLSDAYSEETVYAPADYLLIGKREAGDEEALAIADSNGCASGPTLGQAKLNATLELVERDAIARWWYGRRACPVLKPADVQIASDFADWLITRKRKTWIFLITTDIGIPAISAVSAEAEGEDVAIGSAAHLDLDTAISSALTEMVQMEFSLELCRRVPGTSEAWDMWRSVATMATPPLSYRDASFDHPIPNKGSDLFGNCLSLCHDAGISLYYADMTRPALGIPVVKAVSTDLCHYKPRFNRSRLLANDTLGNVQHAVMRQEPNPCYLLV